MFNERLVSYLENNCLLAKQQCGYRSNRSTVDHLVRPETIIRDAFIQNQHLVAVFFDLQKAYDTTWKHGILQDLHDMGLRGNLPISLPRFGGGALGSNVFTICAVYWSLGRRGYVGVSNVALVPCDLEI